jgi:hypothetical protein
MNAPPCPFCELVTETPHETQQGCIDALKGEIARVRGILEVSKPADAPLVPSPDREEGG